MKMQQTKKHRQGGFTLIELMIVIAVVGVLIVIGVNAFRGSSDGANALAINGASKQLAKGVGYMHVQMGTGLNAMSNPILGSGMTMMDVLMVGSDAVNSTYKTRFEQINMRPMEGDFRVQTRASGSTPGVYQVLDYTVGFVACATGKICLQYANVPSETVAELAKRAGISNFAAATGVSTGPLRYTPASNGFHTVTVEEVP
jgi:prepilin-type N-terminal cleavage/methylation domain-containing protein